MNQSLATIKMWWLWGVVSGLVVLVLYGAHYQDAAKFAQVSATGLITAGAALVLGGLAGFLFGLPRAPREGAADRQPPSAPGSPPSTQQGNALPEHNTNLDQVSDWLTKLLLGAGLTQLTSIPAALQQVSTSIAAGLGSSETSQPFAAGLLIYFSICGFLGAYLWTRLALPSDFLREHLAAMRQLEETEAALTKSNSERDNLEKKLATLAIIERLVKESGPIPEDTKATITQGIRDESVKQLAILAVDGFIRKPEVAPGRLRRLLPIIEALQELEEAHIYFWYKALVYYKNREFRDALQEFNKGIVLRPSYEPQWVGFYEAYRTLSLIRSGTVLSDEDKERINADLRSVDEGTMNSILLNEHETLDGIMSYIGKKEVAGTP